MISPGPILYVDDDEDDQFLLRQALREIGAENPVLCFNDGTEVLTYLEVTEEKPFLILCDLNMPLMSGLELRHRINQNERLRQKAVPFVFFTTAASPEAVQQAYLESVQGFYQKPPQYEQLVNQLRIILAYWRDCLHPNSALL